ncbi:transporter substrate-binding domain-containing protein [Hahella sp. CR1]|uniref:substrate-binding periplasmic protein n=1 Tax=Hahella sp. CR1 TaxID=2992807 RepID=UPI002441EE47|nr:transporter substrate-binding domain-containing protein [Hahella sp. CR1]MDG9670546.1 transporter substrate-binding domain-containing protein [Hahella sp. CR1]
MPLMRFITPLRGLSAFAILLACSLWRPTFAADSTIRICTPIWEGYTNPDGTGLYHELWKLIYEDNGVSVEVSYMPPKRCQANVQTAKLNFDAFPGAYKGMRDIYLPRWHIYVGSLSVAHLKGTIDHWIGQEQLRGQRVSWEPNSGFDQSGILTVPVQVHEFVDIDAALKMLDLRRIDYILDYEERLVDAVIDTRLAHRVVIQKDVIPGAKFYLGFRYDDEGRKFAEIWDREMDRLMESGKLKELFSRFNDPTFE